MGPTPQPRRAVRLVLDHSFGTFFWGKLFAATGVWAHSMVAAIVAFEATGSALVVGTASAAQFVPQLMLAPLSGRLTDRGYAMIQLLLGRLLCTLGSGGLAVWIGVVGLREGAAGALPVIVSSLLVGCGFATGGPAMQSVIPWIIRPGELTTAMALNTVPMTVSRAAGPALGAVLVAHVSPLVAFAAAGGAHLLFGLGLLTVRLPEQPAPSPTADISVRAAFRRLRVDPPLGLLLLGVIAVGVGSEPSTTLVPSVAVHFGGGAGFAGWLASSFGIGAGLGLPLLAVGRRWLLVVHQGSWGLALLATGLVGASLSQSPVVTLVAFGVSGTGLTVAMTGLSTLLQERAPDHLRGRIMALWLIAFVGSRPPAAALDGLLADALSPAVAFGGSAAVVFVIAWMVRSSAVDRPIPGDASRPTVPAALRKESTDGPIGRTGQTG